MPTTSQVALALDTLGVLSNSPQVSISPDATRLQSLAYKTLADALNEGSWTGKSATCNAYGAPPVHGAPLDQEAVEAIRFASTLKALIHGAESVGKTVDEIAGMTKTFLQEIKWLKK